MGGGKSGLFKGTKGSRDEEFSDNLKSGSLKNEKEDSNTKHGEERLKERGFTKEEIQNTKNTTNIMTQKDGAKVYIKKVGDGKYNVIVEGARGIITALKNISENALNRLKRNYGWR